MSGWQVTFLSMQSLGTGKLRFGLVEGSTWSAAAIWDRWDMACRRRLSVGKTEWRPLDGVACEIHPRQEMRNLIASDGKRDLQNRSSPHFLAEAGVETPTCVLNVPEVKSGGVRDGLNVTWTVKIRVDARNGLSIDYEERLREGCSKGRILQAAIAEVPTGVDVQMHEIRQGADVLGSGCSAAAQNAEFVKVNGIGAFRFEQTIKDNYAAGPTFRFISPSRQNNRPFWILADPATLISHTHGPPMRMGNGRPYWRGAGTDAPP